MRDGTQSEDLTEQPGSDLSETSVIVSRIAAGSF